MLFEVVYRRKKYAVYSVTNKGGEYDKLLIYDNESKKFDWVYIKFCELV